jgi:hypothetical protein
MATPATYFNEREHQILPRRPHGGGRADVLGGRRRSPMASILLAKMLYAPNAST